MHVFTPEGKLKRMLGLNEQALSELRFPYDIAIGPDDALYVIEWGAGRFSKMTLDGRWLGRFGSPGSGEQQFRTPWSIAVDSQGRVRVADTENRRVVDLQF